MYNRGERLIDILLGNLAVVYSSTRLLLLKKRFCRCRTNEGVSCHMTVAMPKHYLSQYRTWYSSTRAWTKV